MFPIAPPALRYGRVSLAPIARLEGLQRLQAGFCVPGTADGTQRRHDGFPVLVGDELQRVPDQMHDAGLDDRLGKDGGSGLGKTLQAVDHSDRDVLAAAAFRLVHHPKPERCPFGLLDPAPEDFLAAVGGNGECDIDGFVANKAFHRTFLTPPTIASFTFMPSRSDVKSLAR